MNTCVIASNFCYTKISLAFPNPAHYSQNIYCVDVSDFKPFYTPITKERVQVHAPDKTRIYPFHSRPLDTKM